MVEQHSDEVHVDGSIPSLRTDPKDTNRDPHKEKRIRWGEQIGIGACPYLRRWVFQFGHFSIRVHHFYASDDDRAFHDHPWWFMTLVLKGSYTDWNPDGLDILTASAIRYRPAHHQHTVLTDGVWTLVVTGPVVRQWGFWDRVTGKFVKANKWFFTKGHHPCE